jgi:16S rRNA (cytidine1402-2'-O)-methyltransferase
VTAALAVSGLPSDRFCFEGFLPRRAGERSRRLAELTAQPRTMVFFESPRRLAVTLAEMAAALGAERRAVACRELTKTHEEVRRGTLAELAAWAAGEVRGEVTLVVAGAAGTGTGQAGEQGLAGAAEQVAARVAAGASRKDAVTAVAAELGLRRREVYEAAVHDTAGGTPGPSGAGQARHPAAPDAPGRPGDG